MFAAKPENLNWIPWDPCKERTSLGSLSVLTLKQKWVAFSKTGLYKLFLSYNGMSYQIP